MCKRPIEQHVLVSLSTTPTTLFTNNNHVDVNLIRNFLQRFTYHLHQVHTTQRILPVNVNLVRDFLQGHVARLKHANALNHARLYILKRYLEGLSVGMDADDTAVQEQVEMMQTAILVATIQIHHNENFCACLEVWSELLVRQELLRERQELHCEHMKILKNLDKK